MRQIQKGSVDRSVDLYIIDSTDGTPEVGVLFNTAGIDLKYRRDLSAAVSITEVTLAALTTAHTDGGFLEIGNGVYRLDLPDAAWATGADHVTIFGTVTGMIVLPVTVQLVAYDPESALATPTNITAATGVVLSGVTHTGAVIPTVSTVTGLTASNLDATISSRATPAQVNTEVVDALNVDTYAEPGQGAPAATATLAAKINYLYKAWRNKKTQTATTFSLFGDDEITVHQKTTVSDDATTFTTGEIVTGP